MFAKSLTIDNAFFIRFTLVLWPFLLSFNLPPPPSLSPLHGGSFIMHASRTASLHGSVLSLSISLTLLLRFSQIPAPVLYEESSLIFPSLPFLSSSSSYGHHHLLNLLFISFKDNMNKEWTGERKEGMANESAFPLFVPYSSRSSYCIYIKVKVLALLGSSLWGRQVTSPHHIVLTYK